MRAGAALVAALALTGLTAAPAAAHAVSIGQSKVRATGPAVTYELALELDVLTEAVGLDPAGASTPADQTVLLERSRQALGRYLARGLRVQRAGAACTPLLGEVVAEPFRGKTYALLTTGFTCPRSSGALTVDYELLREQPGSHTNVADWVVDGRTGRIVFDSDERRLTVGQEREPERGDGFVVLGLQHALSGLDHVLFVLALLLGARTVRGVLLTVSAFTAAHTASLGLAAAGWSVPPTAVVEPLIALSLVVVAVQNLRRPATPPRLALVLGFGLVHGLGFASGLDLDSGGGALGALLAFNVGVELAQVCVLAAAAPALLLLRRQGWSRRGGQLASASIAVCGAGWLVTRLPWG